MSKHELGDGEPSPPPDAHKRQRCGHRTLHACPSCRLCFSCCDCREFGKELGITFYDDIAEDGEGSTPWEVPAEPEPLYFETLREAIKGYINMLSKECDKLESGAAQEVSPPSPFDAILPENAEPKLDMRMDEDSGERQVMRTVPITTTTDKPGDASVKTRAVGDTREPKAALRKLVNESKGFLSMAVRDAHGDTNMRIFAERIVEAEKLLG